MRKPAETAPSAGTKPPAIVKDEGESEAVVTVEDNVAPLDDTPPRAEAREEDVREEPREPRERRSVQDDKRAAIVKKFRESRDTGDDAASDIAEINAFAHQGLPPELLPQAQPPEPEEEPDAQPEPPPAGITTQPAPKVKLKVRGSEIEMPLEEVVAKAQIALAADDYLDEAKGKLQEVNALLRETKSNKGQRAAQDGEHHAAPEHTQTAEPDSPQDDEGDTNPFVKVVEKIQYGAPEEAARELERIVSSQSAQKSRETLAQDRLADEAARTSKHLKDFQSQNSELANDPRASAAIERDLYDLQVEDMKSLGVTDEQLPKTPHEIAQWHQWYRANGFKVRSVPDLLTMAKDRFEEWRGPKKAATTTEQPPNPDTRQTAPKVNVDRTARRAAVPQQPSRSATPRPAAAAPPPVRDRSDVVQQMARQRAAPRGRVVA